jgi:hypothetical protein
MEQWVERGEGAGTNGMEGPREALGENLHALGVDMRGRSGDALSLPQKGCLPCVCFNEVNSCIRFCGQRACDDQPGKPATAADVDPCAGTGREIEKLE